MVYRLGKNSEKPQREGGNQPFPSPVYIRGLRNTHSLCVKRKRGNFSTINTCILRVI